MTILAIERARDLVQRLRAHVGYGDDGYNAEYDRLVAQFDGDMELLDGLLSFGHDLAQSARELAAAQGELAATLDGCGKPTDAARFWSALQANGARVASLCELIRSHDAEVERADPRT